MKTARTLLILRIVVSVVLFVAVTLGALLPAILVQQLGAMIKSVQIIPALTVFSMIVFVAWLCITLIFGRVYCSTVCPLGTLQDCAAHRPRRQYHYKSPRTKVRYTLLVISLVALMSGSLTAITYIDPYSEYVAACQRIFGPLFGLETAIIPALISGAVMMIVLYTAYQRGRDFVCNTVCPVGTALGLVSRYSVMHIDINTDKCIQCRRCEHVCKSLCINLTDHVVDGSRCVNCFNCINVCPNDAIHYTSSRHQLSWPMMQRIVDTLKPQPGLEGAITACNKCSKPNKP